jgi:threonyl-tRNA synthetase
VSAAEVPYAREVLARCGDVRAEIASEGSLGARIRDGRLVPYQAVIGPQEVAAGQLSVRLRDGRRLEAAGAEEVVARIEAEVRRP